MINLKNKTKMLSDKSVIELCKNIANKGYMTNLHGAILISSRGKILSEGYNKHFSDVCHATTHLRQYASTNTNTNIKRVRSIHAEVSTCSKIPNRLLKGAVLYIIRTNRTGDISNSEPCKACKKFLIRKGISKVYYSKK